MHRAVSRRRFLGTAGDLSRVDWPAGRLGRRSLRADDAKDLYGGFPMGIQSYTLRAFSFDKAMEIIHEQLGLHFVELTGLHLPVTANDELIKKSNGKLSALAIKAAGHGVNGFSKDHEANRRSFRICQKSRHPHLVGRSHGRRFR